MVLNMVFDLDHEMSFFTMLQVFDITNYENFEKENKKTPVVEKPPEPEKKPKEIKVYLRFLQNMCIIIAYIPILM